jgi:16S rRNA (cytidine1402-2'-O)-methyltransferase
VLFETAPRLAKSLADMADLLGAREAAICKELTKLHETVTRGLLDALAVELAERETLKGEFVVVVAPPAGNADEPSDEKIEQQLAKALKLESFRDAVRLVAEVLNVSRARVYELGLKLKRD